MPRIPLTDITLKNLKPSVRQVQYWDRSLPSFGCRVSQKGTKTFNIMTGKDRRLIKIGNYPSMTLSEARRRAHELMDDTLPSTISFQAARQLFFDQHLSNLKQTTAQEQKNLMRRFPFAKPLASVSLADIQRVLDDMPRGSARSCYNIFRTFLNWCVINDYLEHSPLKPRSPYKAPTRDRLLTDEEIRLIWIQSYNHEPFGAITRSLILSGQRLSQFTQFQHAWVEGDTIAFPPCIMKSNRRHIIPLTPTLNEHLPTLSKPFTHLSGTMQRFRAALPEVPHFTCHDYRRYFSSTASRLRTPIDHTEAILDHTTGSRSQVQRIYDRFDRLEPMRDAMLAHEHNLFATVLVERTENLLRHVQRSSVHAQSS